MNLEEFLNEVQCPSCTWRSVWGPEELLQSLRQIGTLRRQPHPQSTTILQLAESNRQKLKCPLCGHVGLRFDAYQDGFDDAITRSCERCKQPIPAERLDIFPNAKRCAACQDAPDAPTSSDDFCPRCGARLVTRLSQGAGLARYKTKCESCGFRG